MQNNQAIPFNKENFKQILSKGFAWVIIVSIPGALIADYFNIPLAWFLGPMLATSIVSLKGVKTKMPRLVLSTVLIFLGLYIGSYVDKNLFSQIHQWIWTSLIMLVYIIVSVLLISKYLQKFSGYGKKTSIFSAAPGALGPLLILAEARKEVFEFFDNVKVNEENETLRKNRLELINMFCKTFQNFINFQLLKANNE